MIPFIVIDDKATDVLAELIPEYYLEYRCEKGGESGVFAYDISNDEDIPASFIQGMKELGQGLAIDFDKALKEPPTIE